MANTKSAKKRVKQNEIRRIRNSSRRSAIKTAIKKVLVAIDENNVSQAQEFFKDVSAKLARAKGKGLLHANTAARKMSRLAKRINAASEKAEAQK